VGKAYDTSATPRAAASGRTHTGQVAGRAGVATYVRDHWTVENRVHWVRDVTFREDGLPRPDRPLPRVLATFRNLAIGPLRLAGHTRISPTRRRLRHDPALLLTVLGLKNPA